MKIAPVFLMLCVTSIIAQEFLVSVQKREDFLYIPQYHHVAGGNIIHHNMVLTVAHIFETSQKDEKIEKENYRIEAGVDVALQGIFNYFIDPDKSQHQDIKLIKEIYIPKEYVPGELCVNDIAVIELSTELDSYYIRIINIIETEVMEPISSSSAQLKQRMALYAWSKSLKLKKFHTTIPDKDRCPKFASLKNKLVCFFDVKYKDLHVHGAAMVDHQKLLKGIGCLKPLRGGELIMAFAKLDVHIEFIQKCIQNFDHRDKNGNTIITLETFGDNLLPPNTDNEIDLTLLQPTVYQPIARVAPLDQKTTVK